MSFFVINADFIEKNIIGICHLTVFLTIYFSNISYVGWGIFSLANNSDVITSCKEVWIYDLIGIIYAGSYIGKGAYTFGVSFRKSQSINDMTDINDSTYLDYVMLPSLLVWGLYIVVSISDECLQTYIHSHKDIWDLCQGTFYGILSMVVVCVCLEFVINRFIANKISNNYNKIVKTFEDPLAIESLGCASNLPLIESSHTDNHVEV